MKLWPKPSLFSGSKFAARYGLDPFAGDFGEVNEVFIWVRDEKRITDDPPIFEAPDPAKAPIKERLDQVQTLPELITILKERL